MTLKCEVNKKDSKSNSGSDIMKALENSVSKYPSLEGRFAQISGMKFGFDPTKPPGKRVDPRHVKIQGHYIDLDKVC